MQEANILQNVRMIVARAYCVPCDEQTDVITCSLVRVPYNSERGDR
jgi:hypothetical protein